MHRHGIEKVQDYVEDENGWYNKGNIGRISSRNTVIERSVNFQEIINHDYYVLFRREGPYWKFTTDIYDRYVLYIVIEIFSLCHTIKAL